MTAVGRGFVGVDSSGNLLTYTGRRVDVSAIRSVAVFHQFHCLVCDPRVSSMLNLANHVCSQNELRIGYYVKQTECGTLVDHHVHRDPAPHHSPSHMKHRFDYLRQSLMCTADTTLESLQSDGGAPLPNVDGW